MAEKSGAANTPFQFTSVFVAIAVGQYAVPSPQKRPIGIAMMVVNTMPSISAPVTLRATSTVVTAKPIRNVTTTGLSDAECTMVTGSPPPNFAFTRPIRLMKRPMPHDTACRRFAGMASTASLRALNAARIAKITPDQNTQPSAVCHGILLPWTITNVKSAFMPMPGATSTGLRAYRPIAQLPRKLTMTVAVSAAGNGTPAADRMPGLTTMMYIAVRKVVMPATTSVLVRALRGCRNSVPARSSPAGW